LHTTVANKGDVEVRTTVITGAGSGIGLAVARRCEAQGDTVIGIDIRHAEIEADLSMASGRYKAIGMVERATGGAVDCVIACAGVGAGVPAGEVIGVNYFGVVELLAGLRPMLAAGDSPRVVVVSSESLTMEVSEPVVAACLSGDESEARKLAETASETAYFSSKKALSLWVKRLAVTSDWAGKGVLLNAVAPGIVATPMTLEMLESEEGRELINRVTPTCMGRPAQPEEIAELIVFMASIHNSYMLGQTVFCDGGAESVLRPERV